jgi:hypothetical protein
MNPAISTRSAHALHRTASRDHEERRKTRRDIVPRAPLEGIVVRVPLSDEHRRLFTPETAARIEADVLAERERQEDPEVLRAFAKFYLDLYLRYCHDRARA